MLLSVDQVQALLKMIDFCINQRDEMAWDNFDLAEAYYVRAELKHYLETAKGHMADATEANRGAPRGGTVGTGGDG